MNPRRKIGLAQGTYGPPYGAGQGTRRLMLQVVEEVIDNYPDGVWLGEE